MQNRRLITVLTLIAFLPVAAGCSRPVSVALESDPASEGAVAELQAGWSVTISGYTRVSDGYRDWNGQVWLADPDSLEFISEPTSTQPGSRFRLPCEDVVSLTVVETDQAATVAVVVVSVLAVGAVTLAIVGAAMANSFEGMGN